MHMILLVLLAFLPIFASAAPTKIFCKYAGTEEVVVQFDDNDRSRVLLGEREYRDNERSNDWVAKFDDSGIELQRFKDRNKQWGKLIWIIQISRLTGSFKMSPQGFSEDSNGECGAMPKTKF